MNRFVSIYLAAVKKKSLRDEIVVEEVVRTKESLPSVVREVVEQHETHLSSMELLRKRDTENARNRLEKIREQINKRSSLVGAGK